MSPRFFCGLPSNGRFSNGLLARLIEEEEGQTLVEYGLLISFIALVVISAVTYFGKRVTNFYNGANNQLPRN